MSYIVAMGLDALYESPQPRIAVRVYVISDISLTTVTHAALLDAGRQQGAHLAIRSVFAAATEARQQGSAPLPGAWTLAFAVRVPSPRTLQLPPMLLAASILSPATPQPAVSHTA